MMWAGHAMMVQDLMAHQGNSYTISYKASDQATGYDHLSIQVSSFGLKLWSLHAT